MSIPLIYIAGPFRGPTPLDVRRNVEAARDVGLRVAACGGFPIIPHCLTGEFDKQLTEEFWVNGHMELLSRCDGLVVLATWERSQGARQELEWAVVNGMPHLILWPYVTDLGLQTWMRGVSCRVVQRA